MTVFTVYDPDTGRITQANKHYSPEGYADVLNERGMRFVSDEKGVIPDINRVHVHQGQLADRPMMPISVSKSIIKFGDKDAALMRGLPKPCYVTVKAGDVQFFSAQCTDGKLDFNAPVPGRYTVTIEAWPHQIWQKLIEVVA